MAAVRLALRSTFELPLTSKDEPAKIQRATMEYMIKHTMHALEKSNGQGSMDSFWSFFVHISRRNGQFLSATTETKLFLSLSVNLSVHI